VFDPGAYWVISRAMDLFEFGALQPVTAVSMPTATLPLDTGNTAQVAAARTNAAARLRHERALVIGIHEDHLFPLEQQRQLAELVTAAGIPTKFLELHSPHGHDAFLVEHETFALALKRFLNCLRQQDCGTAAA